MAIVFTERVFTYIMLFSQHVSRFFEINCETCSETRYGNYFRQNSFLGLIERSGTRGLRLFDHERHCPCR